MSMTIYGLTDPRDNLVHYVGKTNQVGRRLIEHRNEHGRVNEQKTHWLEELQEAGYQPVMMVLEVCSDEEADARELHWIRHGREFGWPLVNKAHGLETTERKLDELITRAERLGLVPPRTFTRIPTQADKRRLLPEIVERAEAVVRLHYNAMEAARQQAAEIETFLEHVTEVIYEPD